jgi:hypothetical protein
MNKKHNLWTVLSTEKIYRSNHVYLSCRCDCGTVRDVIIKNLKSGVSSSCGCERNRKTTERNTKHGKRFTKVWRVWQDMKARCYNKNRRQYCNYGGRGIKVCDEWRNSFIAFYEYIGDVPKGKTLDRIDNNGNYEPGNVRWATPKEQCQNKTNNHKIKRRCISEIDKDLGGRGSLVSKRLKRGWSLERAITERSHAK